MNWKRLLGMEKYDYHPVEMEESLHLSVSEMDGMLLKIVPYTSERGMAEAKSLLNALHDEHHRHIHSWEVWFHQGSLQFFLYVEDELIADDVRKDIAANYPNADVTLLQSGVAFPDIPEGSNVTGGYMKKSDPLDYLPIREYDRRGWDEDPYGNVLSQMLSSDDTSVVLQCVGQAYSRDWTDSNTYGDMSAREVAERYRQPTIKGWWNQREVPPSKAEKDKADIIEEQAGKPAFGVNIRVLAISPDPVEASRRAGATSLKLGNFYDAKSEQGLDRYPIDSRFEWRQKKHMMKFIKQMQNRTLSRKQGSIYTTSEYAGIAHLPPEELDLRGIQRVQSRSGASIPASAPKDT